jgi:hypothetical protein
MVLGKQYSLHDGARRLEANDKLSDKVRSDINSFGFIFGFGFVVRNTEAVMPLVHQKLPEDFQKMIPLGKRSTVNFRFKKGIAQLDNKSLKDVERLAQFITVTQI